MQQNIKRAAFFRYRGTFRKGRFDKDPKTLGKNDKLQKWNYVKRFLFWEKWN